MSKDTIRDLTLMLMYLTSWEQYGTVIARGQGRFVRRGTAQFWP